MRLSSGEGGLRPSAFLCLRWSVLIGAVVVWNALNLLAIALNGGFHTYRAPSALAVLLVCVLIAAAFMWLLALNQRVVNWASAERRVHYYHQPTFVLAALVFSAAAIGLLYALVTGFRSTA